MILNKKVGERLSVEEFLCTMRVCQALYICSIDPNLMGEIKVEARL